MHYCLSIDYQLLVFIFVPKNPIQQIVEWDFNSYKPNLNPKSARNFNSLRINPFGIV